MAGNVGIKHEGFQRVVDGSVTVSTTITSLDKQPLTRGVEIVAYAENVGNVYVSRRKNATADEGVNGGFRLLPGASVFVPTRCMGDIWIIGTSDGDDVSILAY